MAVSESSQPGCCVTTRRAWSTRWPSRPVGVRRAHRPEG